MHTPVTERRARRRALVMRALPAFLGVVAVLGVVAAHPAGTVGNLSMGQVAYAPSPSPSNNGGTGGTGTSSSPTPGVPNAGHPSPIDQRNLWLPVVVLVGAGLAVFAVARRRRVS